MGQIAGNAPVKPCKRFLHCGGIIIYCMDGRKAVASARAWLIRCRAKIKALHCVDTRQKKSPAISDRVECFLF
jgi:hypothetical protein